MTVKPSILVFTHDHLDQNDSETVSHFLENDTHARAGLYVWNRETSKHHFLAPICTEIAPRRRCFFCYSSAACAMISSIRCGVTTNGSSGKMLQIACYQIGIIRFSLFHDDFVEYAILWIRHDYVHFFCVYT